MEGNEKLEQLFLGLAREIHSSIDRGVANGALKPESESFFHWRIDNYKYGDNGPEETGEHGEYTTRTTWFTASVKTAEEIQTTAAYKILFEQLKETFGEGMHEHILDGFIGKVTSKYLETRRSDEGEITTLAKTFLKGLRAEPLVFGAEAALDGIILQPEVVEFAHGYTLRRTAKEDLENEIISSSLPILRRSFYPIPSAMLKIEFLGTRGNEIQQKVEQVIAMLRLFKVGSVGYLSYHMYSESLTHFVGGTLTPGNVGFGQEKMVFAKEDVPRLQKFWQSFAHVIPQSLYWPPGSGGKEDHITIAYRHYCDALLQNGLIERRIANAIMGLESLFLKPHGEAQELTYRLKNRIAKLLSNFNLAPLKIEEIITDAYHARNRFAHGGRLSYNERKKLEGKYGDLKDLLKTVLNYLRISIIASTTIQREKDSLVDLIDASLVDLKSNEELNGLLNSARYILVDSRIL